MEKEQRIDFRKLLLDCIHRDRSRFPSKILGKLDNSQWQELVELAAQQRIMPRFEQKMKQAGMNFELPRQIAENIALYTKQVAMDNLLYFSELEAILKHTNSENIPVILLKGMHLAMDVYPEKRYREMNDMDLLFRVKDLPRSVSLFLEMGYKETVPVNIEKDIRKNHQLEPLTKGDRVVAELHWNITRPFDSNRISPDDLWERCIKTHYRGQAVYVLSPEDLLLHVCQHNSYHHLFAFGLRPFCDIAEIIDRFDNQLDWQTVLERAARYRWMQGLLLTLWMAKDMTGARVPSQVFSKLKTPGQLQDLSVTAREQVFVNKDDARGLTSPLEQISEYSRLSEKLSYMVKRIFLPKKDVAIMFGVSPNSPLIYGYYLLRLWKKLTSIARHFFRRDEHSGKRGSNIILSRKMKLKRWLFKHNRELK